MIVIVDYGMGNVGSIRNMFRKIGETAIISRDPSEIDRADKLVLPGVGAFDAGMHCLEELGLVPLLNEKVMERGTPALGICLGMQLLMGASEEGRLPGLGWIDGQTVRFRPDMMDRRLKVPHMGWNTVEPTSTDDLFGGLPEDHGFYFVHSFHVVCDRREDVLATTAYGYEFASAVRRANVFGTQFHPEKSHRHGLRLLANFVRL